METFIAVLRSVWDKNSTSTLGALERGERTPT